MTWILGWIELRKCGSVDYNGFWTNRLYLHLNHSTSYIPGFIDSTYSWTYRFRNVHTNLDTWTTMTPEPTDYTCFWYKRFFTHLDLQNHEHLNFYISIVTVIVMLLCSLRVTSIAVLSILGREILPLWFLMRFLLSSCFGYFYFFLALIKDLRAEGDTFVQFVKAQ